MTKINKFAIFFVALTLGLLTQSSVAFAATSISSCNSVTLNGYVAPKNGPSTVWFEWSTNTSSISNGSATKTPSKVLSTNSYFTQQVTGLSESTTYYYRTAASNVNGTIYGSVISFTTASCGGSDPGNTDSLSITTNGATNIGNNSATLNSYVNKSGSGSATRWFEYGTNSSNLSYSTNRVSVSSSGNYSSSASGLSSDTTYYFRAVAEGSAGNTYGTVRSFRTSGGGSNYDDEKPSVTTNSAAGIGENDATLKGYIDTNGTSGSEYWFEWGTSSGNLNRTTNRVTANNSMTASSYISGLSSNTTYYFRIIGSNGAGTSYGSVRSFVTDNNGGDDNNDSDVVATTKSASNIGSDYATINGYVDMNGSGDATRWFEWGRTSSNLSNTTSQLNIGYSGSASSYISGLSSDTTYYFRIVARNDNGTVYGSVYSFRTNSGGNGDNTGDAPIATTKSATGVDISRATLNGYVDANNTSGTYGWFEWGRSSSNLTNSTSKHSQGSSDSAISSSLTGLTSDTTYYYRAVAKNDEGTSYGSTLSFTTSRSGNNNDDDNKTGYAPIAETMLATNVGGTTATLNSLVLQTGNVSSSAWFEWGTSQSLGRRTSTKNVGSAPSVRHAESISGLSYGTTYYFRVVAENVNGRNYGIIRSFVAKPEYVYVAPKPAPVVKPITIVKKPATPVTTIKQVTTVVEHAEGVSSLVMLTITGEDDTVSRGVGEDYTVTWRNQSNQDLRNVVLRIMVPQSLTFESADDGSYSKTDGILTILIGNLNAGEEGQMHLILKGANTLKIDDLVVTTANIVYTDEYSIQGDALAYTTQRVTNTGSVLGASIGGVGGISFALFGWLILIILLIILAILIHNLYQRVSDKKE